MFTPDADRPDSGVDVGPEPATHSGRHVLPELVSALGMLKIRILPCKIISENSANRRHKDNSVMIPNPL